ncbi:hypothetical protein GGP41_006033 [Bipolaris sorokiniana]|uniref:Prolidase n=1 Tax=Cochliobolus sativus TaxID=45130 RepID=A0A8H5ZJ10_COCSA|nr:hypothetical protein GGP41_006033 [Bipolaris sorokiniana]
MRQVLHSQCFCRSEKGATMQVLDATSLAERLRWEDQDYWLHLEAETPFDKYPAKQHARRVQEKMGIEHGLIYLPGQPARNNEDSDMPAPFRQRRYFYYLSGCVAPKSLTASFMC